MSLRLDRSLPHGLKIKTSGFDGPIDDTVYLGRYQIPMSDFLVAVAYVLTNTDLQANDPRIRFVESLKALQEVDGYNPGQKRLEFSPTAP
jgi:hypothetical protein